MLTDLFVFFFGSGGSGPSALAAGTATFVGGTYSAVNLQATPATGGTDPVTVQWQRSARGVGSFSNLAGLTTLAASDTTAADATLYDYRVAYTDAASSAIVSNTVGASKAFNGSGGAGGFLILRYP